MFLTSALSWVARVASSRTARWVGLVVLPTLAPALIGPDCQNVGRTPEEGEGGAGDFDCVAWNIVQWILTIIAWGGGIAFVFVGALFCWAYIVGHGSRRIVRALGSVAAGCILVTCASALAKVLVQ